MRTAGRQGTGSLRPHTPTINKIHAVRAPLIRRDALAFLQVPDSARLVARSIGRAPLVPPALALIDFPVLAVLALFGDRAPGFSFAFARVGVPEEAVVAGAECRALGCGQALPLVVVPEFGGGADAGRVEVSFAFAGACCEAHGFEAGALLAHRALVFRRTARVIILPLTRSDCWLSHIHRLNNGPFLTVRAPFNALSPYHFPPQRTLTLLPSNLTHILRTLAQIPIIYLPHLTSPIHHRGLTKGILCVPF